MSLIKFSDKMKEDIKYWWKTNILNSKIDKRTINKFKELILHELIHYKNIKNSALNKILALKIEKIEEEGIIGFYYNASCTYAYPYKFNLPKYYPKFVLIEFKNLLFDVIYDIFKFDVFTTLIYRLFNFLICLIMFKEDINKYQKIVQEEKGE